MIMKLLNQDRETHKEEWSGLAENLNEIQDIFQFDIPTILHSRGGFHNATVKVDIVTSDGLYKIFVELERNG